MHILYPGQNQHCLPVLQFLFYPIASVFTVNQIYLQSIKSANRKIYHNRVKVKSGNAKVCHLISLINGDFSPVNHK